ncbi:MAG: hypothetical protein ACRDD7_03350 [Peptostreptococcaceae bacterium]
MYKYKKHIIVGSVLVLSMCILYSFTIYSNFNSNKNTSTNKNTLQSNKDDQNFRDVKSLDATSKKTNSNLDNSNTNQNINDNSTTSKSYDNNNGYSILVSSSFTKALISLDENSKEVKVKLLDDKNENIKDYDNYINVTDEDIKFLSENADTILNDFKEGSLLDKYSFVCDTLKNYDTDLSSSDLINIAFMYIK